MRNLLSCLAIAMFAGIIGCSEPAAPPATTPADGGSGSETTSTDAASPSTGEMTSVSLNVPGMT